MSAPIIRVSNVSAARPRALVCKAAAVKDGNPVPDMSKRTIMNGILVGAGALPATAMAAGFIAFFVPPKYGCALCLVHVLAASSAMLHGVALLTPRADSATLEVAHLLGRDFQARPPVAFYCTTPSAVVNFI